jgi:pseudouridine synthase
LVAAYHKPLGVVSSMRDDHGRPDLSAVLPQPWQKLLHPVGRLDADTTGLLLFCRDGDLTHRLLHPKYVVEREYVALVDGAIDAAALGAKLRAGVETVEDGETLVVQAELLGVDGQSVRLVVTEGKYRMVRRILANCGHPVIELRVRTDAKRATRSATATNGTSARGAHGRIAPPAGTACATATCASTSWRLPRVRPRLSKATRSNGCSGFVRRAGRSSGAPGAAGRRRAVWIVPTSTRETMTGANDVAARM